MREKLEALVAERERRNAQVNEYGEEKADLLTAADGEERISGIHIEYEEDPREYSLFSMTYSWVRSQPKASPVPDPSPRSTRMVTSPCFIEPLSAASS